MIILIDWYFSSSFILLFVQVWSDELATIAQNYAEKCIWGHNQYRSDDYPGYVGENLYQSSAVVDIDKSVNTWYREVVNFDYATNRCFHAICGHYTQVCCFGL